MKKRQPRIVTIGGGSGQSTILQYLKHYPFDLTALVSMVDNGGSTGRLRAQLDVMPPGDVRRCITALARRHSNIISALDDRFTTGHLQGHALGNLILSGLELTTGNFIEAIQLVSSWLDVQGRVLPISAQPSTLYAQLENGQVIVGETNIDIPKHRASLHIERLYLKPAVTALPEAIKAILKADYIILSLGDLYTSVLPNLLVRGVAGALRNTRARILYTCNRVTKLGETRGYTALDYIVTIEKYLEGRRIDIIVVDQSIARDRTTRHLVKYNRIELQNHGLNVIEAPLRGRNGASIDGKKLAAVLARICQQ